MRTLNLPGSVALALLLGLFAAAAGSTARAAPAVPAIATAPPTEPGARAARRKPRIVHLPSPSQESPAQRDRRLARECRGLPNAGACLGHALPRPRAAPPGR